MAFSPQLWGVKTLQQLNKELLTKQRIVNSITDYTPLTRGKKAEAYNGPSIGSLSAVDLPAETGDINDPTKTAINIAFDQEIGVPVYVKDIEQAQTTINLLNYFTGMAKDALLDKYDLYIIQQIIQNLADANRELLIDDANNIFTKADIMAARSILNAAGAPLKGRTLAVCPDHEADLYDIDSFVSRDKIPDTAALRDGVIGRVLGFDVILFNEMPLVGDDGVIDEETPENNTQKVSLAYSSLCLGFGRQKEFGSKIEPQALTPADLVNIYSVFGTKIQFDTYAVSIRDNVIV